MTYLWESAILIGATVTTGLNAGLFHVFAHSVMPGLGSLDDRDYLAAFGAVDRAIPNPWMGLAFIGSPALTAVALILHLSDGATALWLAAALVGIITATAITVAVNLPLNRELQRAAPGFPEAGDLRRRFESRWRRWNVVRTVAAVGALVALGIALLDAGHQFAA